MISHLLGGFCLELIAVAVDELARVVASVVGGIDISLSGAGYYPLFFALPVALL